MLDFREYFLTLLFIGDSHFTFHDFFILWSTYILESGGILWMCLCIHDWSNSVDPHMIIRISLILYWIFVFS
jgi:hypothetical protein